MMAIIINIADMIVFTVAGMDILLVSLLSLTMTSSSW